jgi:hypothetical protein
VDQVALKVPQLKAVIAAAVGVLDIAEVVDEVSGIRFS